MKFIWQQWRENIYDLLQEFGGDPLRAPFGFTSTTICHNPPGDGSRKLYYYENSGLFKCYTGCDATFDIFELAMKVNDIQNKKSYDLNTAVRFIAYRFGISGTFVEEDTTALEDWSVLNNYDRVQNIEDHKQKLLRKMDFFH